RLHAVLLAPALIKQMAVSLGLSEDRAGLHDACMVGRAAFCLAWILSNVRVTTRELAVLAGDLRELGPADARLHLSRESPVITPPERLVESADRVPYAAREYRRRIRELAHLKDAPLPTGLDLAHSLSHRVVSPRAHGRRASLDHLDLSCLGLGVEHVADVESADDGVVGERANACVERRRWSAVSQAT